MRAAKRNEIRLQHRNTTQRTFENLEARRVLDSTVVFNEIMYNPAGQNDGPQEWIEFYNQLAVDMDISDWVLRGGVEFDFADGTTVPGRGHLLVAADPEALKEKVGDAIVLGPWSGRLNNDGEELLLYNNDGRLMNSVEYRDGGDWPSGPDGSGLSLSKGSQFDASHLSSSWTISSRFGGTPGIDNVVEPGKLIGHSLLEVGNSATAIVPPNGDLGDSWTKLGFDDSAWLAGSTPVGFEGRRGRQGYEDILGLDLHSPPNEQDPMQMEDVNASAFIRIPFEFHGDVTQFAKLRLLMQYDDGFVAYLNGVEIAYANAPGRGGNEGELNWDSNMIGSTRADDVSLVFDSFDMSAARDLLNQGENILALHGLNRRISDNDLLFTPRIIGLSEVPPTPVIPVVINEVDAVTSDNFYVEIKNTGTEPVDINGFVISSPSGQNEFVLGQEILQPGDVKAVSGTELGIPLQDRDLLILQSANKELVVDSRRATNSLRGRNDDFGGKWLYPTAPSPNASNSFAITDDLIINEIMYHAPATPPTHGIPAQSDRTTVFPMDWESWRYNHTGDDLGVGWQERTYAVDNVDWFKGQALLGFDTAEFTPPVKTEFIKPTENDPRFITYYFQTEFDLSQEIMDLADSFEIRHLIDDGAVFYVNGREVLRHNMPDGEITAETTASMGISNATKFGPVSVGTSAFHVGTNVLSAEVHLSSSRSNDIIFGAELVYGVVSTPAVPGTPYEENTEEWIELFNKGDSAIDLTGWSLTEGIDFQFAAGTSIGAGEFLVVANNPDAFSQKYPDINVVGGFSGRLSDHDDLIRLETPDGNLADEVHYFEGAGTWPEFADGGGSSLELIDPHADNSKGTVWAASEESAKSEWVTHNYRGTALRDVTERSALYNEFIFGLLDNGEFLIDDIQVVFEPTGPATPMLQNGDFESDVVGEAPEKWRIIGNHSGTVTIDPTNPNNQVLHVVATGAQAHVHDHAETTFVDNTEIEDGSEYEISFRAKWLAGNGQVNSRLYFSRIPSTAILDIPDRTGTPGAVNSTLQENIGPTFTDFQHNPTTPVDGQPATVSVRAEDPNNVASVDLWWRPDGGAWNTEAMTMVNGFYQADIPGHSTGQIVQFYVEGTDSQGATTTYPPQGEDSRALLQVDDGQGPNTAIDTFRIIMTAADEEGFFQQIDRMTNRFISITLVHNNETYYNVGTRQVGSRWIRPNSGYKIRFDPEKPLYGVHDSVRFDLNGLAEIVMKQMINRAAGGQSSMYDDISYLISPQEAHSHEMLLNLARFETIYLNEQFENGSEGTKWELDDVTYPSGTPRSEPEARKRDTTVNENADIGVDRATFRQQGVNNPEFFRGHLLIKSNRVKDDFGAIERMASAIHRDGDELFAATNEVMDVDLWMRHYANQSYLGNWDTYGFRRPKNLRIYLRPEDNKLIPFFWDCDLCNYTEPILRVSEPLSRLDEIRDIPHNLRLFWGHMLDYINRSFNAEYIGPWAEHYNDLSGGKTHGGDESFRGITESTSRRSAQALEQIEQAIPKTDFNITTNDGNDLTVDTPTVTLEGTGWVDVRQIRLAGTTVPLDAHWFEADRWRMELPVSFGSNTISLEAVNYEGEMIAEKEIHVESTALETIGTLRVTEINYNPGPPNESERNAGYDDKDDYEFIEFANVGDTTIALDSFELARVDINGEIEGVDFKFADGTIQELSPGGHIVVVEDMEAFRFRYGDQIPIAGQWSGALSNGGETLTVLSDGVVIQQFAYADWYAQADGNGETLTVIHPTSEDLSLWNRQEGWQPSGLFGGTPGTQAPERIPGDSNGDGIFNEKDLILVFQAGEYEDGIDGNSTFAEGDWNGDGDFTTADLVHVMQLVQFAPAAVAFTHDGLPSSDRFQLELPKSAEPVIIEKLARENARRRAADLKTNGVELVFASEEEWLLEQDEDFRIHELA